MKFLVVLIAVCFALTSATYNFGLYGGSRYGFGLGKGFGYNYRFGYNRPLYRFGLGKGFGLGSYGFRKGYGRK